MRVSTQQVQRTSHPPIHPTAHCSHALARLAAVAHSQLPPESPPVTPAMQMHMHMQLQQALSPLAVLGAMGMQSDAAPMRRPQPQSQPRQLAMPLLVDAAAAAAHAPHHANAAATFSSHAAAAAAAAAAHGSYGTGRASSSSSSSSSSPTAAGSAHCAASASSCRVTCVPCHNAKTSCDGEQPCARCMRLGRADACVPRVRKEHYRARVKRLRQEQEEREQRQAEEAKRSKMKGGVPDGIPHVQPQQLQQQQHAPLVSPPPQQSSSFSAFAMQQSHASSGWQHAGPSAAEPTMAPSQLSSGCLRPMEPPAPAAHFSSSAMFYASSAASASSLPSPSLAPLSSPLLGDVSPSLSFARGDGAFSPQPPAAPLQLSSPRLQHDVQPPLSPTASAMFELSTDDPLARLPFPRQRSKSRSRSPRAAAALRAGSIRSRHPRRPLWRGACNCNTPSRLAR